MFFDYHIHSSFSSDSDLGLEEIIEKSIKIGLDEIAITDHYDPGYPDPSISFPIDKDKYLLTLEKYQQEYNGQIKIKKGLELGLQSHVLDKCLDISGDGFDFIIASFHAVQKKDLYRGTFFEGYTQWEAYREYLKEILHIIREYDQFNVIGHLDVIRRYGDFPQVPDLMEDNNCRDLIREILQILIEGEKGLEVNTSGFHFGDKRDPLPSWEILQLYHELGGEILTTGSDSHFLQQMGHRFSETQAVLKEIGFKYLTTFTEGKPEFHKLL